MRHVLIADDHAVTRLGLREVLKEAFEDVDVEEVADGAGLRAQLGTRPWSLILLDVSMPGSNILESIAAIRATSRSVPVLVLTAAIELEYVIQSVKAGANGLIHKHRAADDLLDAIRRVESGGTYLHSETATEIAASLGDVKPPPAHHNLSERELEIFRLIAVGRAVKEIAADLGISDKTVATYLARIRDKTGLTSAVEIARYALKNGLVQ